MILYIVISAFLVYGVDSNVEKYKSDIICLNLNCKSDGKVCGIRSEGEGYRIRLFPDECALLNYKCAVKDNFGYEVTDMDYCSQAFYRGPDVKQSDHGPCAELDCLHPSDDVQVCGLRRDGKGFRIRIFRNKCKLSEHNCVNHLNFTITDFYICNGLELPAAIEKIKQLRTADMPYKHNIVTAENLKESENQNKLAKDKPFIEDAAPKLDKHNAYNAILDDDFYIASNVGRNLANNKAGPTPNIDNAKDKPFIEDAALKLDKENAYNAILDDDFYIASNVGSNLANNKDSPTPNIDNAKDKPFIEDAAPKLDKENAYNAILDDDFYIASDIGSNLTSNNVGPIPNIDNDYTNSNDFTTEPVSQTNVPTEEHSKTTLGQDLIKPETMNENIDPSNPDLNEEKFKNIVVIHGVLRDMRQINETINRFFAATHVFDLPIKMMPTYYLNETTRRRLIEKAGPISVFSPVLVVPKNVSEDRDYEPTLRSCYHKCPKKCPSTYAPVCGLPGRKAREPSLMFQNHCFMDVAQCKQFWEDKSPTSLSSAYNENTFVFCLGDTMNNMYHFLPLLKTLQHMGRLPKKGRFHYRLSNLKFFNNMMNIKNPNLQG